MDLDDQEMIMTTANVLNLEDDIDDDFDDDRDVDETENYLDFDGSGTMSEPHDELPADGVLDEDIVGQGLSNLGRTADGTHQVFLHLTLPGLNLRDIIVLSQYDQLQKVELPYNDIMDCSVFGNMPFLLHLDLSHNSINKLLDFTPPKNLRSVNLAYNHISVMTDLSAHQCLMELNLDHNGITEIAGLAQCNRLSHLSLAHNHITQVQGLDRLPVKHLDLSFNQLRKIENLGSVKYLQSINLAGNKIRSLEGLEGHEFLTSVDIEENEIIDLSEINYVKSLALLRWLNLLRNPVQELPDYRLSVLFHIQQLSQLDRKRVDVHEKVSAHNLFNPPMEVIASRDHIMHVVYSFLQPSRVHESTLPSTETPYPMLVLVGPQGAGKTDLSMKLVDEFSDYFGYGLSHTTRSPLEDEVNGKDYHFVSVEEFESEVKKGKFIQTYSYNGSLYGLSIDAIEAVARDGLACVIHMELEGVLTLKNTYFEPRYVLILSMSSEAQTRRLQERGIFKESTIQWNIERTEMYGGYNQEHPGFFDMMINSDDIFDAYRRLRRLVMDYLGISAPSPTASELLEQSQSGSHALDREVTETMTANSANMGARSWSKPSIADSASQALASVRQKQAMSPMPASGRGVVEEESIRRRHSAAKEAVCGRRPSLYDMIFSRGRTVPQPVSAQMGLGDEDGGVRSSSAPGTAHVNMDALPPGSPDSSSSGSGVTSSLGDISEARDGAGDVTGSLDVSGKEVFLKGNLPNEKIDPLELMSADSKSRGSNGPLAPRQMSGAPPPPAVAEEARPGSSASNGRASRLGSDKHAVLPPIGSPLPVH